MQTLASNKHTAQAIT